MPQPIEPEPIRREIPKRSEMMTYTTHASSFIKEKVGDVLRKLTRLAPGMLLGFTRIDKLEEEVGVSEERVEELPDRANMLIGYYHDTRPPLLDTLSPVYPSLGTVSRRGKTAKLEDLDLDHPEVQDNTPDSSDPETSQT